MSRPHFCPLASKRACRRKRSGSMLAVLAPTPTILTATVPQRCLMPDGMVQMRTAVRSQYGLRPSVPMPSACGTCMAMWMSGASTLGTQAPTLSAVLWLWIPSMWEAGTRGGSSGAARGSSQPGTAAPLSAPGTTLAFATGAGASAFACPPARRGCAFTGRRLFQYPSSIERGHIPGQAPVDCRYLNLDGSGEGSRRVSSPSFHHVAYAILIIFILSAAPACALQGAAV